MDYEGTTAHNTSRNMEEKQQPKYCTHTQTKKRKEHCGTKLSAIQKLQNKYIVG